MNPREKKLLVGVGGVLVVLALNGLWKMYQGKHADLDQRIDSKTRELNKVNLARVQAKAAETDWKLIGKQTLSLDEKVAKTLLRDELIELARASGLPNAKPDLQMVRSWSRHGVRVLNASLTAEGTLDNVLKFLFGLYRQPFLVRCKAVDLTPIVEKPGGTQANRNAPPKPTGRFTLAVRIETLLLPGCQRVPASALEFTDLRKEHRKEVPRTELASVQAYTAIKLALFEPARPPIPPPGKPAGESPGNNQTVEYRAPNFNLRWNSPHATTYELFFDEKPPGEPQGTITAPNWKPPKDLEIGKKYYWRVVAINDSGRSEGDLWSFTPVEPTTPRVLDVVDKPPPPVYPDMVIQGVVSSPLIQAVVLQDARNKNAEPKRVEVGEQMNLGTLVFIHPSGAVTQEQDGTRRFHPVGTVVKDGPVLSEQAYPLVFDELTKLQQRTEGISGGVEEGVPASKPAEAEEAQRVGMAH